MHFLLYSYALTGIFIISRCSEGDVFKIKKTVFVFRLTSSEVTLSLEIIIFAF